MGHERAAGHQQEEGDGEQRARLPVGVGQPTLKIDAITVGGTGT